jgi:hypothetical protein
MPILTPPLPPFLRVSSFLVWLKEGPSRNGPFFFTMIKRSIDRACLESRTALLRLVGADIAGDH